MDIALDNDNAPLVVNVGTSHVGNGNSNNGIEKLAGEFSPFPPPLEICLIELPMLFPILPDIPLVQSILPNIPLAQLSTSTCLLSSAFSDTPSTLPTLLSSNPLNSLPLYLAPSARTFKSLLSSLTALTPNPPYPALVCDCVCSVL